MKKLDLTRLLVLFLAYCGAGPAAETPAPAIGPCRGSGFVVIQVAANRDLLPKPDSNFEVYFDQNVFRGNSFEEALKRAADAWSGAGSNWRFQLKGYTDAAYDTDARMSLVRGLSPIQLPSRVLAVTFVSTSTRTGQIVDSDIFYNPGLPIDTYANFQEFDFELIALHEMGHALGLDHNDRCTVTPTVMESTVTPGSKERRLYQQEIDGVKYLYSGREAGVALSPLAVSFLGVEGNASPAPQTINLTGPAGTAWTAGVSAGPWLSISAGSGGVPAQLSVRVSAENLNSGLYRGSIVITSGSLTQVVPVELNLAAPILALRPRALSFGAVPGGPAPDAQILGLVGTVGSQWNASASTTGGGDWLRLSVSSGRLPATISVTVNAANLTPGIYTGAIRVSGAGETRETTVTLEVAAQSRLQIEPGEASLTSQIGSALSVCAPLRIGSFGNVPLDWRAATDAPWLSVLPSSGRAPLQASVCAVAGSLQAGQYTGTVTVTAAVPNSPQTATVRFNVTPAPALPAAGVTSAASFAAGPVAAGQILSLFGTSLAGSTAQAASFPLPTELAGTRVLIGGVPAPLLYVSPGQINLVTPNQLRGLAGSGTSLTLYAGPLAATPARITVARSAPGVFTVLGTGAGAGAITHADGSVVSRANPIRAGEIVSVYLTGMGPLDPSVGDGEAAPGDPLARATVPVGLLLDAQAAEVLYAGAAPGFAGLQVVVARVPDGLRRFPDVVVEAGGVRSSRTSAGGPSLLDISPAAVPGGADAVVTLRGINLPDSAAVRVAGENLAGSVSGDTLQTLQVTIPARLLTRGTVSVTVADPSAPAEASSNPVTLTVQ